MQIGLVGMPNSGKTTLFELLTGSKLASGSGNNGEAHLGSAIVPDNRIGLLSSLYKPRKITYARINFKDIPGVRMDDSKNRASRLLDEVRSADALVQVVRAFNSEVANQVAGNPDPYSELVNYGADLILADIDILEKRIARIENTKKPRKEDSEQIALLEKLLHTLESEKLINSLGLTAREKELLAGQSFLSEKPLFIVINIDESQLRAGSYPDKKKIAEYTAQKGLPLIEVCAQAEYEISTLAPDEQLEFMQDLGLKESGLGKLARMAYKRLSMISFFTVGDDEVKAWTLSKGAIARQAAGRIHTDIERGFIRAEVFHYDRLEEMGSASGVREAGHFRLEGKEYTVTDGDIISFRFNV